MVPNADDMVRELHVRTVQFVHKHLSAAKPASDGAAKVKGGTLEEQISRLQQKIAMGVMEASLRKVEISNQQEVMGTHMETC